MAKIPPALMQRLQEKLQLTAQGVYTRIASVSKKHHLTTRPAAIKLAMDSGVGYRRFATEQDLHAIRGTSGPTQEFGQSASPASGPSSAEMSRRPRASRRAKGQRAAAGSSTFNLFISHIHEEAEIAGVLRNWFHAVFPGGRVAAFVSSDYEDNPLGRKWLDVIDGAMDRSRLMITLLSPQSMDRMWIHMEAGWALGRKIDILPICHSGTRIDQLPRPYSDYSGTEVERSDFARRLLMALKQRLGLDHQLPVGMLDGLANDVRVACNGVRAQVEERMQRRRKQPTRGA
jgi:hypothetical protein